MHDVKNIPELIALLMPEGETSFEVLLPQELHRTLRACLELGMAELIAMDPYCLPPRLGAQLRQKQRFQGLHGLDERISVDAEMVTEGIGWVEHFNYHPRLTDILTQMMALAMSVSRAWQKSPGATCRS